MRNFNELRLADKVFVFNINCTFTRTGCETNTARTKIPEEKTNEIFQS